MGYRSCGVIAIPAKTKATLLVQQIAYPPLMEDMQSVDVDTTTYWEYEDWKMYIGYEDVDAFHAFMDKLDDSSVYGEDAYAYVRIGEDNEDIEERGCPYTHNLNVERYVSKPY